LIIFCHNRKTEAGYGGGMEHHWDENGFLASSADAVAKALLEQHQSHFQRAADLNRDCHELLFSCKPRNRDGQQVLVAALFLRLLEHFQATVILLRRGLVSPGVVMARACLEAVFAARAIALAPDGLRRFILDDQVERLKLANKADQYAYPNLEDLRQEVAKGLRSDIESEIEADGARRFSTEDMSRLAGMHDWYITIYPLWSKTAHSRVRDLEQYLDLDEKGEIRSLKYAPGLNNVSLVLLTTMHALLLGAEAVGRLFDCDCPASFPDHEKYLRQHLETPVA
jgi:hypothetical protein